VLAGDDLLDLLDLPVFVREVASGGLVHVNAAACRLVGASRKFLVGTKPDDFVWDMVDVAGRPVPPEARPYAQAVATRAPVRDALIGLRVGGAGPRRWHLTTAIPRLDDAGTVTHVALVIREISEELLGDTLPPSTVESREGSALVHRLLAEFAAARAAVAEQARLQASVVAAMQEGVVVHGPDGAIESANPAAERILGLKEEQMRGVLPVDPRWRLTDAAGAPLPPDRIPAEVSRRTGTPHGPVLLGVHHANGRRAWLRVSTSPLREPGGPNGRHPRVVTTFVDVTDEQDARRALEESRANVARLVAAAPGVLYRFVQRTPTSGAFDFVSQRSTEVLGLEPEVLIASPGALWDRVNPDDLEAMWDDAAIPSAPGTVVERDFRLHMPDGTMRWIRTRAMYEPHADGRLWTGLMMDVTQEKRVAEHLRHAQRREAIGDLTAGVAHNFNNLLASMIPNLEEVRTRLSGAADPELRALVEEVERAAWAGADLVRQLMRISRREATPSDQVVRVADVVRDVAALCRRSLGPSVTLRTQVEDRGLAVRLRASDLHQALLNLVLNARDAVANKLRGHIDVEVRAEDAAPTDGPDGYVVVRVRDDGCGMPPAVLERLGEPFFTTKPPDRGTGLGLATVYSIVRDAGGGIACRSECGRGSVFELRLPRATIDDAATVEEPAPRSARRALEGLRVLVVDDEPLVRSTLARSLRRAGSEVLEAGNGAEALEVLGCQRDVDAVLLDVDMPMMDGREALRRILARGGAPPVLMVTGDPGGRVFDGAVAVLDKPLGQRALTDAIARAVAEHRAGGG
jgi:signal transduction histidine kinase